ncbi:N-acetylmuramoyl-L-alanine amidase [Modestobacter sp. SYSU DS0657]
MRRILTGLIAFLLLTGTFLVLPVYAEEGPQAQPVVTSSDEVPLGSVEEPAPEVEVQEGTTDPVEGVPAAAPTLSLTRTDTAPFSLVGVTWAFDPQVADTVVQVRVRDAEGVWGSWTEVTPETADQQAVDTGARLRGGTSPLWTGPGTGVQVELVTRSGAQPTDVALDLIDPGSSPADGALDDPEITDTAHAAATMPAIYSRAQWGADERIRTWNPQYASTIKAATLHHTADSNSYSAADVPAIMRSIYRYHTVSLGWGDIGYNVIVDKFGRLWEGRYGGLASTVVAAHAGGFNTSTWGVSMLGNYDVVPVPQATVDAVAAVIAWKFGLHRIDPNATTVLTSSGGGTSRYSSGTRVTLPTIFGHRDVGSTACPGRYGYARLGEIRASVTQRMGATSEIAVRYSSDATLRSVLGSPVGVEQSTAGVSWQAYQNGRVYWSPRTGARALWGDILNRYLALGGPAVLGAPVTDHLPTPARDGYYAWFQSGAIYWTPSTGSKWVRGWVGDRWAALGREAGVLGFPTSEEKPAVGGVFQEFQRGVVYSSASTGAHEVHGWVLDKWTALGRERGVLGYPTSDEIATSVGAYNTFTGGAIYSTPAGGPRAVRGWIGARWLALGAGAAAVGHPLSDEQRAADGVGAYSEFSNGVIYSSAATGAHDVTGPLATAWSRLGGVSSFLGYPTADTRALGGGQVATFQGGSVYRAPGAGVAYEVHGWIGRLWQAKGGATGATLGWPTSDEQSAPDRVGVFQTFANGLVYSSPSGGAREVHGLIEDKWTALGGLTGRLGPPVTDELTLPDGKGRVSHFSGDGSIYYSPASGAWEVRGWVRSAYSALNAERGFLGYPIADEGPAGVPGAVVSRFQGGNVYASGATGAREVHGAILARYLQLGGPASALGLPTSNEYAVPGGRRSDFERGSITCNTTTGSITVTMR